MTEYISIVWAGLVLIDMKNFARVILFLLAVALARPAYAIWAHVQTISGFGAGSATTSLPVTFASNVSSGDIIIVTVGFFATTGVSVTDSQSNTYTQIANVATNPVGAVWWAKATSTGSLTVTFHCPTANYPSMTADEYSASPGTISVVTSSTNSGTSTSPTSGSMSFTNNSLIYNGVVVTTSPVTYTAGSGYTLRGQEPFDSGVYYGNATQDLLNTSSSPKNAPMTLSGSVQWRSIGAVFQSTGDLPQKGDAIWFGSMF